MLSEKNFEKEEAAKTKNEVIYNPEMEQIAEKAAEILIDLINKKQGVFNMALCGGRSAIEFYKKIAAKASEIKDPKKLHIFLVDERYGMREGDYDINDRNTSVIETNLVKKLNEEFDFPEENFHKLPEGENVEEVTKKYNKIFRELVPDGKFDLSVLGSGEDGHLAGIFPGKEAANSHESGFAYELDSPKYPPIRITALPKTIQNSSMSFLFIIGKTKEQALKDFKDGKGISASVLEKANKAIIFTDIAQ